MMCPGSSKVSDWLPINQSDCRANSASRAAGIHHRILALHARAVDRTGCEMSAFAFKLCTYGTSTAPGVSIMRSMARASPT